MNFNFEHPFTCLMTGPTGSGKTWLLSKILENSQFMIHPSPKRIVYCYSRYQPKFDEIKSQCPGIEFNEGLPDIDLFNQDIENLIILDDLMHSCEKDIGILNLFTVDSHHQNISVFFLTQNLFSRGKNARTISLNSQYIVLLNNPRDHAQIYHLARQVFPTNSKFMIEAYEDSVKEKYGYLLLDFKQSSVYRVQTGIFPKDSRIIYQPKIY